MAVLRKDARSRILSELDDGDGHIHVVVKPDGHIEPVSDPPDTPAEPVEPLGPILGPETLDEVHNEELVEEFRHRRYGFPYLSDDLHGGTLVGLSVIALVWTAGLIMRVLTGEGVLSWATYRSIRTGVIGVELIAVVVALTAGKVVDHRRASRAASSDAPVLR